MAGVPRPSSRVHNRWSRPGLVAAAASPTWLRPRYGGHGWGRVRGHIRGHGRGRGLGPGRELGRGDGRCRSRGDGRRRARGRARGPARDGGGAQGVGRTSQRDPLAATRTQNRGWVVFGLVAGAASGAASGPRYGIVSWAVLGALTAVGAGAVIWVSGQNATELDLRSATSPATVFAGDRRTGTALGVVFGVVVGVMLGVVLAALVSIGSGWALGVASGVVYGLISGVVGAGPFSSLMAEHGHSMMARIWLGLRHRLPWPLMDFLVTPTGGAFSGRQARSTSSGTSNCSTGSPTGTQISRKQIRQPRLLQRTVSPGPELSNR